MPRQVKKIPKNATKNKTVIKPFADGTITSAAFFSSIRAALRNKSRWWPSIKLCKDNAREAYIGSNKRRKWSYKCENCNILFDAKEVVVHHKIECGSLNSFEDLPQFAKNLFCDSKDLALICKECHTKEHNIEKQKKIK